MNYLVPCLWSAGIALGGLLVYAVAAMFYRFCRRVWRSIANRLSPQKIYRAVVVGKREEISRIYQPIGFGQAIETDYYITFEFPAGERREYYVDGSDYGLVRDGDAGTLTLQGTWFCAFERTSVE